MIIVMMKNNNIYLFKMLDLKFDLEDETPIEDIIDEKITEGPVKDIAKSMSIKIKQDETPQNNLHYLDYLLKIITLKPIAFHKGRVFDAGMPRNPKYDTYVYDIDNTQILKIINCNCGAIENYMIIKELAYQTYAKNLSNSCNFETPNILDYGRIKLSENMRKNQTYHDFLDNYTYDCIWVILMNKMTYKTLAEGVSTIDFNNRETCNNISNKINTVRRCMEDNGLFHNDFHEENVLIDTENGNKIGIIDFGLADTEQSDFTKDWEYTCNKLIAIKRNRNMKSPTSVSNIIETEYGGNRKTNRRKTNRRKSNRTKTNRTKTNRTKTNRTKHRKSRRYKK